jgi:hypothetical protein
MVALYAKAKAKARLQLTSAAFVVVDTVANR